MRKVPVADPCDGGDVVSSAFWVDGIGVLGYCVFIQIIYLSNLL